VVLKLPDRPHHLADAAVAVWSEAVTITTYPVPPPDRNPLFLEHRVYQGSSGRVYPNAVTDRVSDTPVEQTWEALHLENRWLRVMVLPALGGRIHVVQDRCNGYDLVYRQNVIKPALVGLLGPWISGGIELNWPQHHRPSTFMPTDWAIEVLEDGGATVWCSEHEPMDRMKGMHGVTLRPDAALLELRVRLSNRTPLTRTFLWWANVAARVHDGYEAFFPPDVQHVADHARRAMSTFPVARGRYYGVDYGARTPADADLRWYRNIPVPTSFMVTGTDRDFFGGYDHAAEAGFVHWADHTISPGKKLWTWGDAAFGHAWDRELTDADGPYIELMAGVYTDNQPDFSFLAPGETRAFSQYWYPIERIGPAHAATLEAAAHVEVSHHGHARIGVAVTRERPAAEVVLQAGGRVVRSWTVDLAPDAPLVEHETALPPGTRRSDLHLIVRHQGATLVELRPTHHADVEPPQPAREPPLPKDTSSVEELVLIGRHLEQYRHATRQPQDYWREALRREPHDSRANTALGMWHLRRGELTDAEMHLRRAVATLTRLNANPPEGEALYALGLVLRMAGHPDEAEVWLAKATWNAAWQAAANVARAEIRGTRGAWAEALVLLDRALESDARHAGARVLRVAALRRLGRLDEAVAALAACLADDPLDARALVERDRLVGAGAAASDLPAAAVAHLLSDGQTALDVAHDDARAGLLPEAISYLERALPSAGATVAPLIGYTLGWLCERAADPAAAARWRYDARSRPIERVFPARPEEIAVLTSAVAADPGDARAPYLLGLLLYDRRRYDDAIACWETSRRLEPTFATVHRNLGLASFNVRRQPARARASYLRAFRADPTDGRVLYEFDQLRKRLGEPPVERLGFLERHSSVVAERDDLTVERVTLLNEVGRHTDALLVLGERRFHPWEGGEGLVSGQWIIANRELGRAALKAGRAEEALAWFVAAMSYPTNLGEGKHLLTAENELQWLAGRAEMRGLSESETVSQERRASTWLALAAAPQGDPAAAPGAASYWRSLAMRALGDTDGASHLLRELLASARRRSRTDTGIDYFATSLPSFLVFEDDLPRRNRTACRYLEGLALQGLGRPGKARAAFAEVAAQDVDHLDARLRLRELDGQQRGRGARPPAEPMPR